MICHLLVINKKIETKVARSKDIVRNLNATQINSCSKCHLGLLYVKTNTNFNRSKNKVIYFC